MARNEFSNLQRRHNDLYKRALEEFMPHASRVGDATEIVENEIDPFLNDVETFSKDARNVDEYRWLSDAAAKWNLVLSNMNVPRQITLHRPSQALQPLPSPRKYLSEGEVRCWLEERAYQLSRDRLSRRAELLIEYMREPDHVQLIAEQPARIYDILGYFDREREAENDWLSACVEFTIAIFKGEVDFVREVDPEQYWRLEQEWFEDAKRLLAYKNWLRRGGGWGEKAKVADFYAARNVLTEYLDEPRKKASSSDFDVTREYIERNYLHNGVLSENKVCVTDLIKRKAERLHFWGAAGSQDANWYRAVQYVKDFYENIVPAVEHQSVARSKCLHDILCSPRGRRINSSMINMFEITVYRYFVRLDA